MKALIGLYIILTPIICLIMFGVGIWGDGRWSLTALLLLVPWVFLVTVGILVHYDVQDEKKKPTDWEFR